MKDLFDKCDRYTMANEFKAMGLFPYFRPLDSRQDTEVIMEGRRRIMLGSNNYLGLTVNPRVMRSEMDAVEAYGTGCSGSRFLNGTLQLHLEFEKALKDFLGQEDILTFGTGFQANLGAISCIAGKGDYIICDRENHASIYDGCRLSYAKMLRYKHADMAHLERLLQEVPEESGCLIVTDGVFSMGDDIAKLPDIVTLARKYGAKVMVDDAHALGVLGKGGRGTASHFGLESEVDMTVGTFSKSLASLGGFVAGSHRAIDYIRHNSRPYIFSASMPPANVAAAHAALNELIAHPELVEQLQHISAYMREKLLGRNVKIIVSQTPIIPIYTYEPLPTLQISSELFQEGVYVNSTLPPACAPHECLLRCSLMASHTEALVDEAVDILCAVLKRHELC